MKYEYLNQLINSRGIKKSAIARKLSIGERSLRNKIDGTSPLYWEQACKIQHDFFPDMDLQEIFRVDSANPS